MKCFNCETITSTKCLCWKKPKRRFSNEFEREECEYLELNNLAMDHLELQMLPKFDASQIERTKLIGTVHNFGKIKYQKTFFHDLV